MSSEVTVREVGPEHAEEVLSVILAGFGARPPLHPPPPALQETVDTVRAALAEHGGLLAEDRGRPVGALLVRPDGDLLRLRRVAVRPEAQGRGVAGALVRAAEAAAAGRRFVGLRLTARADLPATVRFWRRLGYSVESREGPTLVLSRLLPLDRVAATAEETRSLGERLAGVLRAGDLVILSGDLGAGKTTFTQGIGAGLGVRGDITSPTFVIARVHPSLVGGPPLVHADAYRIGGVEELDDLDLDASLEEAVTVVEWGEGVAEGLAETRLEVTITRPRGGDPTDAPAGLPEVRRLRFTPVGSRWVGSGLAAALGCPAP